MRNVYIKQKTKRKTSTHGCEVGALPFPKSIVALSRRGDGAFSRSCTFLSPALFGVRQNTSKAVARTCSPFFWTMSVSATSRSG